jgi:hypothetical protein
MSTLKGGQYLGASRARSVGVGGMVKAVAQRGKLAEAEMNLRPSLRFEWLIVLKYECYVCVQKG